MGLQNVEFRLGEIEHLPLADNQGVFFLSCPINNFSGLKEILDKCLRMRYNTSQSSDLALRR
jgi:hypothetical protein